MSSIWKDGKYYKARLTDGRIVHLGTPEKIVEVLEAAYGCSKCSICKRFMSEYHEQNSCSFLNQK